MIHMVAQQRKDLGKRASRRLRRADWLPACIQLRSQKRALTIFVKHNEVFYSQDKDGFLKNPLEIRVEGDVEGQPEVYRVTFQEIQRHPFKNLLLHVDFLEFQA